jgi:hypothetical protein
LNVSLVYLLSEQFSKSQAAFETTFLESQAKQAPEEILRKSSALIQKVLN